MSEDIPENQWDDDTSSRSLDSGRCFVPQYKGYMRIMPCSVGGKQLSEGKGSR